MKSFGALPISFLGGLLISGASSRFLPTARDMTPRDTECTHVALDEWSDASHVAFRQGCGEMVDSLYAASKDNLTIQYVSANQVKGTVLPQYHSVRTCSIAINSAVSSPTFAAQVGIAEIFKAAYILYNTCVSDHTAPQGSFGGTTFFHRGDLTLTFSYAPTPGTEANVSLTVHRRSIRDLLLKRLQTNFFGITAPT